VEDPSFPGGLDGTYLVGSDGELELSISEGVDFIFVHEAHFNYFKDWYGLKDNYIIKRQVIESSFNNLMVKKMPAPPTGTFFPLFSKKCINQNSSRPGTRQSMSTTRAASKSST